ncbi:MAG: filamentous hemagglutinin N-terminal domain-containing protein [Xenococcaceae cyanobacterium MO_167.B27]|nr:filamentous hemagglutinin N-terminal domain-containing protein [Xenococcaceae cyanobacterium MO_167.B27]
MDFLQKSFVITGVTFYSVLSLNIAHGQILPDGTTPNTDIAGDCLIRCDITGGIKADSNLFHSFKEFNIGFGESVYFADPGVANIFSRVTGGNMSKIFGTLGVVGDANLWLLNPKGIIFGRGAALDINGSFVATTADAIEFGDRGLFTASDNIEENLPLLTLNPSALFYHQMGQGNPITVAQGALLTVPNQENVVLLGAQPTETIEGVAISGGIIQAPQGRVEIGAVGDNATIGINSEFQLQFSEATTRGDITISQGSAIDVSGVGGGSIAIQGREVSVVDGSNITSITLGNVDGGSIDIAAQELNINRGFISSFSVGEGTGKGADIAITAESIDLVGSGVENYQQLISQALRGNLTPSIATSGIITASDSKGAAGNITIDSRNISVIDSGFIASIAYNQGNGGSINLNASETLDLSSSGLLSFSAANSLGETGNLNINTGKLILRDGSIVSAATFGKGTGGNISIQASESVELLETPENFILPTTIFTNSVFEGAGNAGNVTIDTQRLVIHDSTQISSASGLLTGEGIIPFGGAGGNIEIRASESITISGNSADGTVPSAILSETRSNNPAGDINVTTGQLSIADDAKISVRSAGNGSAGNLSITADSLYLDNGGNLDATTLSGRGGNIVLDIGNILQLENRAAITTNAFNQGDGGNINIDTGFLVSFPHSQITAKAIAGKGGNITISANDLFISPSSEISASSELGVDGEVNIKTFTGDLRNNLVELPKKILHAENKIASGCSSNTNSEASHFVYVGQGGLPPSPLENNHYNDQFLVDLGTTHNPNNATEFSPQTLNQPQNPVIVEATGWFISDRGTLVLTTEISPDSTKSMADNSVLCPFHEH